MAIGVLWLFTSWGETMRDNLGCLEKGIIAYLLITVMAIFTFTKDSESCAMLHMDELDRLVDTTHYPIAVRSGFLWPATLPMALADKNSNNGYMCLYLHQ